MRPRTESRPGLNDVGGFSGVWRPRVASTVPHLVHQLWSVGKHGDKLGGARPHTVGPHSPCDRLLSVDLKQSRGRLRRGARGFGSVRFINRCSGNRIAVYSLSLARAVSLSAKSAVSNGTAPETVRPVRQNAVLTVTTRAAALAGTVVLQASNDGTDFTPSVPRRSQPLAGPRY
jgi:hypothetical protein